MVAVRAWRPPEAPKSVPITYYGFVRTGLHLYLCASTLMLLLVTDHSPQSHPSSTHPPIIYARTRPPMLPKSSVSIVMIVALLMTCRQLVCCSPRDPG